MSETAQILHREHYASDEHSRLRAQLSAISLDNTHDNDLECLQRCNTYKVLSTFRPWVTLKAFNHETSLRDGSTSPCLRRAARAVQTLTQWHSLHALYFVSAFQFFIRNDELSV